ncbi:MAG TPA: pilus assembly protein N-terminal domain-containing protein [Acidobacteriaceae bacterium]|jgi:pilus assembly protein CpaC|nr:pilus assembly protein N-terminal domain-containing protein [Acidobacteriaceae bacterium]
MTRRESIIRNSTSALLVAAFCAATIPVAAAQNTAMAAAPAANFASGAVAVGNTLRLVVGRSMFVNSTERLRRVYVSNPEVLDSMTSSPHQIVVTAKTAGTSSLILWDETGGSQAYQVTADVDLDALRTALKDALPAEAIRVDARQDQVGLAGTVSNQAAEDEAVKLAGLFSKNVASSLLIAPQHTPQVRLKVRVVEIDRTRAAELGFNFFTSGKNTANVSTGQFPAISVGTVTSPSSGTNSNANVSSLLGLENLLTLFYYNQALGVGAAIEDLENKQIIQILAEPTLSAMSGEKASFLSGGEFPFPVVQGGTGGFTSVTIQFRPYGVKLEFTPTVLPDGTIQLKVSPEVSALDYTNEVQISGYTIPAINTRRADTQVELKSGQSFAIGGLLDNRTSDQLEKVPGIGDIPILGRLFQTKSSTHSVVELAVIVTPTLVDPLTDNMPAVQPKAVVPFVDPHKFDKGLTPRTPPAQPQPQPTPQDVPVVDPKD